MSSDSKQRLDEIVSKIESLNKAYGLHDSSILRGIAAKREDKWYNTITTLTVVSESQEEVDESIEELEPGHIIAFRSPMNLKDTVRFLTNMEKTNSFNVFDTQVKMLLKDDKDPGWGQAEEIGAGQAIHKG